MILKVIIKIIIIMIQAQIWEIWVLVLNKKINLLFIDIHIVSLVSARKLKCPSSARLGTLSAWSHHYYLSTSSLSLMDNLIYLMSFEIFFLLTIVRNRNVPIIVSTFFLLGSLHKLRLHFLAFDHVPTLGWAPWNLSCLEFKFDDTRLSY